MNKKLLRILLATAALCAAPQANAMRCGLLYAGGPWPNQPSNWACIGYPALKTPVSFWHKHNMGLAWPDGATTAPRAYAVCRYGYLARNDTRWVQWHTFENIDGVWYPYDPDRCYFWCGGFYT